MNKNDYKQLLIEWKNFILKENNNLDINNQIYKAEELTKKKSLEVNNNLSAKLKIIIEKHNKNEYELVSRIENDDETHLALIAKVNFNKLPNNAVFDLDGLERNCYIISNTKYVNYNLGPLIYDVIIEFVSNRKSVLCSDRYDITEDAQKIWKNYLLNRTDVFAAQLDIDNDTLDPNVYPNLTSDYWKDDLRQDMSIKDKQEHWYESAFSKGYYKKDTPVINSLKRNKLFEIDIQEP